jgi:tetratricopeptide (TPR) repeat protein
LRVLLAWAHLELGEEAQAATLAEQAVARARAVPTYRALVEALWMQARVATRQGRWTEARRALDEGMVLARRIQAPYAEGRLLHAYGQLHAVRGEGESAHACWEMALAIFQRLGARTDAAGVARAAGMPGSR